MASEDKPGPEEWRLGIELGEHHEADTAAHRRESELDLSSARLDRPIQILTAEHMGWFLIAAWALLSRLLLLGSRPLDAGEAGHALLELDLAGSGLQALSRHPAIRSAWVHLLEAGIFGVMGAGDFSARLIFASGGLLLVGIAFAMRPYVGRAGALGLGALLVFSPSITYFSRASTMVVPALAFTLVAVALFIALARRPAPLKAIAFGCAAGLALSADPTSLIVLGIFIAALIVLGVWELLAGAGNTFLRMQVWWHRRKLLVLLAGVVTVAVWFWLGTALLNRPAITALTGDLRSNWDASAAAGYLAGSRFYLPTLAFYEFVVVILAAFGAAAILTLRIRSRVVAWAVIWTALSLAFCLWTPSRSPELVLQMLVPMALLGALGINYLHHTRAWRVIRYPLGLLMLLTLYVQVLTNFVYNAPDASQAPWARHAILYWTEPATTIQTPERCAMVENAMRAANGTVFFAQDTPVLRWYLRGLSPADSAGRASAIIGSIPAGAEWSVADQPEKYEFELADWWQPHLGGLSPGAALQYLFTARAWGPVESRDVQMFVRKPVPLAPTVILTPGHSP
jgi:uncharacterized protein (TIGR03663 family)